ncbi:MAG: hypothetical protein AAF333_09705 [Planctomycetota bacterium]
MPPKTSLISSAPLRSAVIGGGMLALLFGSLALAWGLTGAPVIPPRGPEPDRLELGGVSITLPSAWQLESESSTPNGALRQWYFNNSVSSAERLRVFRFAVEPQAEPRQALEFLVNSQVVIAGLSRQQAQQILSKSTEVQTPVGEALDTQFTAARIARVRTSPQLHAVRLFTPDRKRYWLFQLTDQIPQENLTQQTKQGHQEQLRRIADTLSYSPSDS